jgi:hypothetical protein
MSYCDTLSEKYNQLNYDCVELMNKKLDLEIEIERLQNIIDGIVIHLSEITTYSFGDNPGDGNTHWMHWRTTRQEVLDIIASDGIEEVKWT